MYFRTTPLIFIAVALFCALIAGCGGGGGGGAAPSSNLPQDKQDLNNIISGQTPPTTGNIGHVAGEFQHAWNNSPNNPDAATGFAISEAAFAGLTFDNIIGGPGSSAASSGRKGEAVAARALRLTQLGQALMLWKLPSTLGSQGAISWPTATDFLPASLEFNFPNASHLQAGLTALDQALASCETALQVPLSNPNFTFTIADPTNHSNTQGLKLGTAEFNLLYAVCAALRGVINPTLAYDMSDNGYTTATGLYSLAPTQMGTNGATIGPAIYMPANPFLTLNPNGDANWATSKSELAAVATHGITAINDIETRDNSGFLLDPGTFITQPTLDGIKTQIQTYQGFLSNPTTVHVVNGDGNTVTTTINLNAWFTHPPADLKAFEPTYTVQESANPNTSTGFATALTLSPSAYPDLTFGGLFPNGFPTPVSESSVIFPAGDPTSNEYQLLFVSSDSLSWLSPDLNWINIAIKIGVF